MSQSKAAQRRIPRALVIAALGVAASGGFLGASADHAQGGSVLSQNLNPVGGTGCSANIDPVCAAWLNTCMPELALRDGVYSSIVWIGDIRGSTRTFRATGTPLQYLNPGAPRAAVFLHDANCRSLQFAGPGVFPGAHLDQNVRIAIPKQARWIVVMLVNAMDVRWSLQ